MPRRLSEEEKLLRLITEASFQRDVEALLRAYGWIYYHAPDNKPRNGFVQNIKAGFPDIMAARGHRLLFAELKRETGELSEAQHEWVAALSATCAEVYVWRPSDMPAISKVLAI